MSVVAVLALPEVIGFEMMTPCQVFGIANTVWPPDGRAARTAWPPGLPPGPPRYDLRICAPKGAHTTFAPFGSLRFEASHDLATLAGLGPDDIVVVPASGIPTDDSPDEALGALRAAAATGARIASICTGALVLAAAGLLDGRRATTHWAYTGLLARRHPAVEVDPAALFIDTGQILTSAGMAAGLDLCLHLVRRDHGAAVATETARRIVMPLQRDGGQAQFITPEPPDDDAALAPLLDWIERHLDEPLTLPMLARQAGTSVRSLHRRFRRQLGTSPLQWLLRARITRARHLLETTDLTIERVATTAGFGSIATLRSHFTRQVGTAPQSYRAAFHTTPRKLAGVP